jgi:hypothetical protein
MIKTAMSNAGTMSHIERLCVMLVPLPLLSGMLNSVADQDRFRPRVTTSAVDKDAVCLPKVPVE